MINDAQYKGYDTVFSGLEDFGHYWYQDNNDDYKQTDPSLKPRKNREPIFKALYGLGCITSSWTLRKGSMVGGKIGIIKTSNKNFSERIKR